MLRGFIQKVWNELISEYPNGTTVHGTVIDKQVSGVWVKLDDLPEMPALLEVIHFEIRESFPEQQIDFPENYPNVGTEIQALILAWCEFPKDVRLTQLNHLD